MWLFGEADQKSHQKPIGSKLFKLDFSHSSLPFGVRSPEEMEVAIHPTLGTWRRETRANHRLVKVKMVCLNNRKGFLTSQVGAPFCSIHGVTISPYNQGPRPCLQG